MVEAVFTHFSQKRAQYSAERAALDIKNENLKLSILLYVTVI